MQAVRISLDAGEKIYSDSGKLVSKSRSVVMTPRMVGGIVGAIERKVTGATGFLTEFTAKEEPYSPEHRRFYIVDKRYLVLEAGVKARYVPRINL